MSDIIMIWCGTPVKNWALLVLYQGYFVVSNILNCEGKWEKYASLTLYYIIIMNLLDHHNDNKNFQINTYQEKNGGQCYST